MDPGDGGYFFDASEAVGVCSAVRRKYADIEHRLSAPGGTGSLENAEK